MISMDVMKVHRYDSKKAGASLDSLLCVNYM